MVAVILLSGSLSTHDIVLAQSGRIIDWNALATAGIPFVVFCIAATAELNRPPFDLVEAEQELVGGFHTEYSSIRFGMFYLAEFMNTITMSAIIVTLFLGGPDGPIGPGPDQLWPLFWFGLKLFAFLFTFVWLRATLPRYRYDQLMDLGWKRLIPLSLVWLLFVAVTRLAKDRDWPFYVGPVALAGMLVVVFGLLAAALRSARLRAEAHTELEVA